MNTSPIAIIDSGVGGLSVWQEVTKLLPKESIIYLCDQKNIPYGTKSKEELVGFSKKMFSFLIEQNVKLVVIGCNTLSVTCLNKLRAIFPQIPMIGTVPVIKTAVTASKNRLIGVLATDVTATSEYQQQLIDKFASDCKVISIGASVLVPFVERGEVSGHNLYKTLLEVLQPLHAKDIDTLCLACTHFPFLTAEIQSILGQNISILDSGGAVARQTKAVLTQHDTLSDEENPTYQYFTTGDQEQFQKVAEKLLQQKLDHVEKVIL